MSAAFDLAIVFLYFAGAAIVARIYMAVADWWRGTGDTIERAKRECLTPEPPDVAYVRSLGWSPVAIYAMPRALEPTPLFDWQAAERDVTHRDLDAS